MRLEEFDTRYSLEYIPGDIQSMRRALNEYTRLIKNRVAFEDSYCVAHFVHLGDPISLDYFEGHQELLAYLKGNSPFFNINSDCLDIQSSTTGEALFFLCAAMHPELEDDMKKACDIIVKFSRMINDSSEMWLTCESPFGIEPLQITATKYPKYGYLLAAFLIPYWDDEHMPEALYALGNWSSKLGITEDTMKAFCYCDNSRARESMLGYDTWNGGYEEAIEDSNFDLLGHFRDNPETYNRFKDILVDRYREMPYLQYCDDDRYYDMNPLRSLIIEILYLHHPYKVWDEENHDMDQWLTNRFIDSQADESIIELKAHIEEKLGRPIVSIEEIRRQFDEKKTFSRENNSQIIEGETEKWQELFLKTLPQGEELWRYVLEGGDKGILDDITPVDLRVEGLKNKCTLGKEFKDAYYVVPLEEEIHPFIRKFIHERSIKYSMKAATLIKDNEALRLYDVLHRIMGEPSLPRLCLKMLRNVYIDLDRAGARTYIKERYSATYRKRVQGIVKAIAKLEYQKGAYLFDYLEELYLLIASNRREIKEMVLEWFNLKLEDFDIEDIEDLDFNSENIKNPEAVYTLIGIFILWKDQEMNIEDEITNRARIFVEEKASKIIYTFFTSSAQWPKVKEMDSIKEYTVKNEYQRDYKEKMLKGCQLWKPFEEYLMTGIFKGEVPKESFDLSLNYLIKYLRTEDVGISEKQPHYDCFDSEEESIFYAAITYMYTRVPDLKCSPLLERGFKLGISLAPMKMIALLTTLIPGLEDPLDLPKYLKALDELKIAGLGREAYWAVQLQKMGKSLTGSDIDLIKPKGYSSKAEDKAKKYYVRLLKLYTDIVVPKMNVEDPMWIMYEEIVSIQEALIEGTRLLDDSYQANYIMDAAKIFGADSRYQIMLDRLALSKVREELKKSLMTPVNYYKKYLEMVGVSYREERLSLEDITQEYLIELGVEEISDEEYLKLKEFYERDEAGWVHQCIVKEGETLRTLYNLEALSFAAKARSRGEKSYVATFFILFIDDKCPAVYEELAPKTVEAISSSNRDINYREEVLGSFDAYLNGKVEIDSISLFLKCAVNEYGFFDGVGWYKGIQIDEIFSYLTTSVQKLILSILSGVSHEKLKKILNSENEDRYLEFMIDEGINLNDLFKYLVNNGKRNHLIKFAKERDCSTYIRSAKVNEMVDALVYIGGSMPKYYPLIVELRNHKSIKIKAITKKLIETCGIDIDDPNPYKIVDYGIYSMETMDNLIEGKTGVTREAVEPKLIKETTEILVEVGIYIGFRFTAKNPELYSKVCHQTVVVTHPYRDRNGEVGKTQTRWKQNGYTRSKIFLGWCFEEVEELIPGDYTFEAYDTSGGLIAKKAFIVKV